MEKKTLVMGVIGADVHAVGNKILYYAFTEAGFNVINLGVLVSQEEFIARAEVPLKEFMIDQTETSSMDLFCDLAGVDTPANTEEAAELPLRILVPAFMTSELKRAFIIGFYLYIPFVLIDVVVSSTLMAMGMIMLPPSMISMPFKLLLFIALNGWELLFSTLVQGFR